jgi:hypothetical protein
MPSSVILRMRYEPETLALTIVFRGGRGTYRYFDVAIEEWAEFRTSGSKGTYLNEVFKAKDHRYEKVSRSDSFRLMCPAKTLTVQDHDRDGKENDEAQQQAKFFEWGETGAFPEPRAQRSETRNRQ